MAQPKGSSGDFLLALTTLLSLQMAQGRTADELTLLSAFFEVLGDNLALLATVRTPSSPEKDCQSPQKPLQ